MKDVEASWRIMLEKAKQGMKRPFCGQQTMDGKGPSSRGRHIGQHLEETQASIRRLSEDSPEMEFNPEDSLLDLSLFKTDGSFNSAQNQ